MSSFVNLATLLGIPEAALEEKFWQHACELRVAIPAVVVSFDSATQTVTVQPVVREALMQDLSAVAVEIPQLERVPIMVPRAGGFALTFPIAPGDECLVVFSDVSYDTWYGSGGTGNVQKSIHRHRIEDGIAIFGLWSQQRLVSGYNTTAAELRSDDGTTSVRVSEGQIVISPDSGVSQIKIIPGEIDLTATVVNINGASYHAHVHSGVTSGGANTGPVTP